MNERLKEIRILLNMNQEEFGTKLGVTKAAISEIIERGDRKLTEQMIKAICREFRVNNLWLTEGQGEPFIAVPDSLIDELAEEHDLNIFEKNLLEEYLNLSREERNAFEKFFDTIFQRKEKQVKNTLEEVAEEISPDSELKLSPEDEKELEQMKQEMLDEKRVKISSVSPNINEENTEDKMPS